VWTYCRTNSHTSLGRRDALARGWSFSTFLVARNRICQRPKLREDNPKTLATVAVSMEYTYISIMPLQRMSNEYVILSCCLDGKVPNVWANVSHSDSPTAGLVAQGFRKGIAVWLCDWIKYGG
jgi:hypothetical protein